MKILKSLIFVLDYMYYRVVKAYMKWDGKHAITANLSISLFLYGLICFPILLILISRFGKKFFIENSEMVDIIAILSLLFFLALVFLRYRNGFDKLDEKYKTERENVRKLKGTLVVFALLLPWLILIIGAIALKYYY